jgi:endonuclease/exonuclease/phosphatase family metal-dependent hydrolase
MKLICLNTWGGFAGKQKLLDFFKKYSAVDIFCLQEISKRKRPELNGKIVGGRLFEVDKIFGNAIQEISMKLKNHNYLFHPNQEENYGIASFIKKNHEIKNQGDLFVYREKGFICEKDPGNHARNIQHFRIEHEGKQITIINFHGLWNGKGKTDTEDRIKQSKNIVNFLKTIEGEIILAGDFNLRPDTESIKIIEEFGLKNLIKEHNITSTRTSYYEKEEKFADYIFVSKGINVKEFYVMKEEVSDHSALFLDFK